MLQRQMIVVGLQRHQTGPAVSQVWISSAVTHVQKCRAASVLVTFPDPFTRGLGGRGGQEKKRGGSRGGAAPADPADGRLLGHSKRNIYASVAEKLTCKCDLLDII